MGLREDIIRRIDKKKVEISDYELKAREGRAYVQGLEETLRLLPRLDREVSKGSPLRPGSLLAKAHRALRNAGRPVHLSELVELVGKANTRANRAGLSGTLAAYVRRGEVFTRPAPNTFGLVEFGESKAVSINPEDFVDDNKTT